MRGKIAFAAGVSVGYVLGTRAGRERFDRIVATARRVWESPTVQEAAGVVQAQATKVYGQGKDAVSSQVHRLGRRNGAIPTAADEADKDEGWDAAVRRSQFPSKAF